MKAGRSVILHTELTVFKIERGKFPVWHGKEYEWRTQMFLSLEVMCPRFFLINEQNDLELHNPLIAPVV